ncbi:MAG: sigma-54-dependent Fis family transcriptional regulator [Sulfuricella sp.]|nr:sigma-54-dependent Fis family transcriptional regulator [Sulfuricella sp.]
MTQILVVDDEVGIRELLLEILHDEGYQVLLAENAGAARAMRLQNAPDLVLLDIWMPDTDGVTLLREWASNGQLTMPVVMMSGHGTIDTAVEATKIGAFDFLEKPISLQKLLGTVERALKKGAGKAQTLGSLAGLGRGTVVGNLQKRLEQIARSKSPLLLLGEEGTGHDLCAHFFHQPGTPWVAPGDLSFLAEQPLHLLEQGSEGVLYLHDVAELGKLEQKGLLLLQTKLDKHSVRLICSTATTLPQNGESAFDAALYQSHGFILLEIPPLREHREDIAELAEQFLAALVESGEVAVRRFSGTALEALQSFSWPGNLAQLENIVKTLALTTLEEEIGAPAVTHALSGFLPGDTNHDKLMLPLDLPLRDARDEFERVYFEHQIKKAGGNMSRVADNSGLERTHLYRKLKQLGIRFARKSEA